ncbi:MAG TPA: MinD/ParA family protein [bacterium]|nr:MinD/ParA family protein [bacterium]
MVLDSDRKLERSGRGFLRRLLGRGGDPARRGEAVVVAFASGKGGTGKSFLTTNLAIGLHQRGLRVCVVDCDFGLGNAHLLFGANPRYSMQHLLGGQRTVGHVLMTTDYGPSLVAGGSGISSLAELNAKHMQMLARALGQIADRHDVVLLDCAAGLAPQSMITVLAAQEVVMVTNPEIAALTDAYAVIKCLSRQVERPDVRLVVNRAPDPQLGRATFDRLSDVSRRFANQPIHYLGAVPEDPAVSHRRLGQAPLLVGLPECRTTKALVGLVGALEAQILEARQAAGSRGVEARMLAQIRRW